MTRKIVYTLVSRLEKPLADFSDKRGSFVEFTQDVLKKINLKQTGKMILSYDE